MKIRILASSADEPKMQFAATYLVDDQIAIDAGSIGFSSLETQKQIRHLFLSHSHLDHINSLPIFLDNVFAPGNGCPRVYASQLVIDVLKNDFFNDRVWPNLFAKQSLEDNFVEFVPIVANRAIAIAGLQITPIAIDHVIPCFAFLIESADAAVAIVSDTGPTDEIWQCARRTRTLKGVFLECAFPKSLSWLAQQAKHLTPQLFQQEYAKLGRDVPLIAIHIKPSFYAEVIQELNQLGIAQLTIGEPNRDYEF
jgi:cAMP phosphodiesterase